MGLGRYTLMRVRGRKSYQPVVPDPFLGPQLPSSWEVGFFQQMSQILLLALMAFGVSQRIEYWKIEYWILSI